MNRLPEKKTSIWRTGRGWKDNIKMRHGLWGRKISGMVMELSLLANSGITGINLECIKHSCDS